MSRRTVLGPPVYVELALWAHDLVECFNRRGGRQNGDTDMAFVKTSNSKAGMPAKRSFIGKPGAAKAAAAALAVELPTTPLKPSRDLNDYHFLIHGEKKIGKTTFTTVEEGVFLLTFDPTQKALEIMQAHCPDWATFMAYLLKLEQAVAAGNYPYRRVVVDGADIWFRKCQEWCEKKLVVEHIKDAEWGSGWDLLKSTFANAVDRLLALPGGCWFISHSTWREVETRKKHVKLNKLVPLLKGGGEEILVGRVDGWFAYDYSEGERILIILGDERTGAGHRVRGRFLTPRGEPVVEIPMGTDEFEAWENFKCAFDNKQESPEGTIETPEPAVSTTTKKPAPKKGSFLKR